MKTAYIKAWQLLLLAAIAVLGILFLTIGGTRAHYESKLEREYSLEYQNLTGNIYLLSNERDAEGNFIRDEDGNLGFLGSWQPMTTPYGTEVQGTYVLEFLLANGRNPEKPTTKVKEVSLGLFSTVGIESPENLVLTLTDGGNTYEAIPMVIQEDSAWYNTYGPGWLYRFYNKAGEELSWTLENDVFAYREMALTVTGTSQNDAALTLIAFSRPETKEP